MRRAIAVAVVCALALSTTVAFGDSGKTRIGASQIKAGAVHFRALAPSVKRKIRRGLTLPVAVPGPAGEQGPAGADGVSCSSTTILNIPSQGAVEVCIP